MFRVFPRCVGLLLLSAVPLIAQAPSAVPPKKPTPPIVRAHGGKAVESKPTAVVAPAPQTAAIVPMTPEQMPAQPPRVSYHDGQLQIDSQNSTLADILNMVRRQTGAQIDPPPNGNERVAAHLSGAPREVISALLDGSNVGYVIMGSPDNGNDIQKVLLTTLRSMPAATPGRFTPPPPEPEEEAPSPEPVAPLPAIMQPAQPGQPMPGQVIGPNGQPVPMGQPNALVGGEQPRFGVPGQPPAQPGQPQVKTPQQLLLELQQLRNRINVNPNSSSSDQQQQ